MKTILLFVCLACLWLPAFSQDQVKLEFSNEVVEGKIFELDYELLKIRQPDLKERKISLGAIDSIYVASDSLRNKMRYNKGTRDKLSKKPLVGKIVSAKSDTLTTDPKELAKSLVLAHSYIQKIRKINYKAGAALSSAGSLILIGTAITVVGSIVAVGGSAQGGATIVGLGGVLAVLGYGKLTKSGNLLRGTAQRELRLNVANEGLALQLKF